MNKLLYHNSWQFFETVFCSLPIQAASLHKLESESSAAGRKLEEAVMRGGIKWTSMIRIFVVLWRSISLYFIKQRLCHIHSGFSLRKKLTFQDTSTGFPAKWHLRNKPKYFILMMHDYPDLVRASDWLCHMGTLLQLIRSTTKMCEVTCHQYRISALVSQTSFCSETSVGKVQNVNFFSVFSRCQSKGKLWWCDLCIKSYGVTIQS